MPWAGPVAVGRVDDERSGSTDVIESGDCRAADASVSGPPARVRALESARSRRHDAPVIADLELPAVLAVPLGVGAMFGALFLWLLGRQDHRTWMLARAPKLPIRALAVGDDAWVRGVVRCGAPLSCPWFDVPCVAWS